jgi:ABC-type lipoprotein release transport system permease subunit
VPVAARIPRGAGLERKQVAGALVSANMAIGMIGAVLGPITGTALTSGFEHLRNPFASVFDVVSGGIALVIVPVLLLLRKYFAPAPQGCVSWF